MATKRFTVYMGGELVATAWSLHAANEKITAAVLTRAFERGSFPVEAEIRDFEGSVLTKRYFPGFYHSDDYEFNDHLTDSEFNEAAGIYFDKGEGLQ